MSFRKINYRLRPAKTVERKMIVEAFRKLGAFSPVKDYQYVGFGSLYFVDFSLLHKNLGMTSMISIEKEQNAKSRFEFNRPFSCIKILFDSASNVLPRLNYDQPTIIWLDYDGKLDSECLSDLNSVCTKIQPGSVLLLTVNVQPEGLNLDNSQDGASPNGSTASGRIHEHRLKVLQDQVSRSKVPARITGRELSLSGLPLVIREIMENEINTALENRNGLLPGDNRLRFQQTFNILYNDGASMLTYGGIFLDKNTEPIFSSANFFELPFCTTSDQPYKINVPNLTVKETGLIDSKLHDLYDFTSSAFIKNVQDLKIIPDGDLQSYAQIYRFYPTFTESIW
ncbi:hypothetical protein LZD49_18500 [Dyadobacter sp. CY261]|uniref:O-methyltransferase n=1 Tax=Dyadobacter sp. CY261 TaxID=2907203 RepID=UPI001F35624F|nr:O-methyltransferase [Dyadobacter sp. CY261]MCF0072479.1 hypothetical protein [Dyadobacter sp. CY261]